MALLGQVTDIKHIGGTTLELTVQEQYTEDIFTVYADTDVDAVVGLLYVFTSTYAYKITDKGYGVCNWRRREDLERGRH